MVPVPWEREVSVPWIKMLLGKRFTIVAKVGVSLLLLLQMVKTLVCHRQSLWWQRQDYTWSRKSWRGENSVFSNIFGGQNLYLNKSPVLCCMFCNNKCSVAKGKRRKSQINKTVLFSRSPVIFSILLVIPFPHVHCFEKSPFETKFVGNAWTHDHGLLPASTICCVTYESPLVAAKCRTVIPSAEQISILAPYCSKSRQMML